MKPTDQILSGDKMKLTPPTREEIEPFFIDFIFKDDLRREVQVQNRFIEALQYHCRLLADEIKRLRN